MSAKTEADIFGTILTYLAENEPVDRRLLALEVWRHLDDVDCSYCDLECDDALVELGLARLEPDPKSPGETVVLYRGEPGF